MKADVASNAKFQTLVIPVDYHNVVMNHRLPQAVVSKKHLADILPFFLIMNGIVVAIISFSHHCARGRRCALARSANKLASPREAGGAVGILVAADVITLIKQTGCALIPF